jgi:CRISPR/Cas system-associated exonuclease Cas4 (RecB family)
MIKNVDNKIETRSFVKRDNVSEAFDLIIQKEIDLRSIRNSISVFNPSQITECDRRMVYRSARTPTTIPENYQQKLDKEFDISKWKDLISKTKGMRLVKTDVIASDCNYNISGTIEAVINIKGDIFVVKIFPISNEDFIKVNKEGAIKKNVIETMIYIWMAETKDGIMVYENKDTNQWISFHVNIYASIIRAVQRKCLEMMRHTIQGTLPKKPYESKTSKECVKCEFLEKCWM